MRRPRLAVPARAFAAALLARHARGQAAWLAPAARIWRRQRAPVALHTRVSVVMPVTRSMRTVLHLTAGDAAAPGARGALILPRLSMRGERVESVTASRLPAAGDGSTAPMPLARPVARILTRPPAAVAAPAATAPVPAIAPAGSPRWTAVGGRRDDEGTIGIERLDVRRLTDHVVEAIDRRLLSHRERMRP